jgi:hypothetical protein
VFESAVTIEQGGVGIAGLTSCAVISAGLPTENAVMSDFAWSVWDIPAGMDAVRVDGASASADQNEKLQGTAQQMR